MPLGLKGNELRVEQYDAEWSLRFEKEKTELIKLLVPLKNPARIEHVGSTSVAGLAAKPIVDIAIGLSTREQVAHARALLLKAGRHYIKWGNQPGMLLMANGNPREVFYHLVAINSPAWIWLVQVRNQLRRYPKIARQYAKLKMHLAEQHANSRLLYAAGKKPLLNTLRVRGLLEVVRARVARDKWSTDRRLQMYLRAREGRGVQEEAGLHEKAVQVAENLKAEEREPR